MNIKDLQKHDVFTTKQRGEDTIYIIAEDTPKEIEGQLKSLLFSVSTELSMGPNLDDTYKMTAEAIYVLMDHIEYIAKDYEDMEELKSAVEEEIPELADGLVPIYNHGLISWLSRGNQHLVDEAVEELGHGNSIISDISQGYYMAQQRVCYEVLNFLFD